MKANLDQRRARFAWAKVQGQDKEYANLAKGVPALIMQSGLMPVLAFLNEKGKKDKGKRHRELLGHICEWLGEYEQFKGRIKIKNFGGVMEALMGNESGNAAEHAHFYRQATEEVLAILRWIRQFASTVSQ